MKKVILDINTKIFEKAIVNAFQTYQYDFLIHNSSFSKEFVRMHHPEVILLEVTNTKGKRYIDRLNEIKDIRNVFPDIKIVFLVDEKENADIATQVKDAKQDGLIDSFIYTSVSAEYLRAVIDSL